MAASGSNLRITYIEETVWGETPATPEMTILRGVTSESLGGSQDAITSNEINPNRGVSYTAAGQKNAGGDISFELGAKGAVSVIAAALGSISTTGTGPYVHIATVGQDTKSLTIEKKYIVDGTNLCFVLRGSKPNTFNMNLTPEGIVTGSINFMSKNAEKTTTELDSTPVQKDFSFFDGIRTTVYLDNEVYKLNSLTFNGTNNMEASRGLGSDEISQVTPGRFEITGSFGLPLTVAKAIPLIDKALNNEESSLKVVCANGSYSVEFLFPRIKFSGDAVPKAGGNGLVNLELNFNALLDNDALSTTYNKAIQLTVTNDEAVL